MAENQFNLQNAARAYNDALAIIKNLAESDPTNNDWQHALLASYVKLGEVAENQGNLQNAASAYGEAIAIVEKLVE